jgi:hypothetical protein
MRAAANGFVRTFQSRGIEPWLNLRNAAQIFKIAPKTLSQSERSPNSHDAPSGHARIAGHQNITALWYENQ